MIYLESNMVPYVGYHLSNVKNYMTDGRIALTNGAGIADRVQQLSQFLDAVSNNNLRDNMQLSLCSSEVVHLQNLSLKNDGMIMQFNTNDISDHINIIDNIKMDNIRLVVIKDYELYNECHFSILKHDEIVFDDPRSYLTVFIDEQFLSSEDKEENKKMFLKMIFTCIDHFISDTSKVPYDVFSEHPVIGEEMSSVPVDLCPRMIFRNRLSTLELFFIADYFLFMCYYMQLNYGVTKEEALSLFGEFPIAEYIGNDIMLNIIEIIYNSIDASGNINEFLGCGYVVAEKLRDSIMNKVYEGE